MTTRTIKLIVFLALLIHGIGHFQGVVASFGVSINKANPSQSWLFKGLSEKSNRIICFVLFIITGITGIITALSFKGILLPDTLWQTFAIVTTFFSTACMIVFPNGFAMFFNKIGAISVNVFVYYSIVFSGNWPTVIFEE